MSDRGIAVVGDTETVLGLAAMGLESFILDRKEQTEEIAAEITNGNFAVLLITEQAQSLLSDKILGFSENMVVLPIASCRSQQHLGLSALEKLIERAIGIAGLMDKS